MKQYTCVRILSVCLLRVVWDALSVLIAPLVLLPIGNLLLPVVVILWHSTANDKCAYQHRSRAALEIVLEFNSRGEDSPFTSTKRR